MAFSRRLNSAIWGCHHAIGFFSMIPTRTGRRGWLGMTFQQLAYFFAAIDNGSLSKVANKLASSKQDFSEKIRQLQEKLGTALFMRTNRDLAPVMNSGRAGVFDSCRLVEQLVGLEHRTAWGCRDRNADSDRCSGIGATRSRPANIQPLRSDIRPTYGGSHKFVFPLFRAYPYCLVIGRSGPKAEIGKWSQRGRMPTAAIASARSGLCRERSKRTDRPH